MFLDIAKQHEPDLSELYDGVKQAARDARVGLLADLMVRGSYMSDELSLREGGKVAVQYGLDIETVGQLVLNRVAEQLLTPPPGEQIVNIRQPEE